MTSPRLSLCLTNYQRTDLLVEAFRQVLDDPRVSEIVISDDCSDEATFSFLEQYCADKPKIRLFRNETNLGMSRNKAKAIDHATEPYCILFDSDNEIGPDYLDRLQDRDWNYDIIYLPEMGYPTLDYTRFANWYLSKHNTAHFLQYPESMKLLNTCNFFVNRQRYLDVYRYDPDVGAADSIWFNYLWLKSGGGFVVVPGMNYMHRVHAESGFMQHWQHNERKCREIEKLIRAIPADV